VVGLLKQYLLELPEPLLAFNLYDDFIALAGNWHLFVSFILFVCCNTYVVDITETKVKIKLLRSLVFALPAHHIMVLDYLLRFFYRVSTMPDIYAAVSPRPGSNMSTQSKLSSASLGTLFGSSILRTKLNKSQEGLTSSATVAASVVTFMIDNWNQIFILVESGMHLERVNDRFIVNAANTDSTVCKLVDPFHKDPDFVGVVLLTYSYFTDACGLLKQMITFYKAEYPETAVRFQKKHRERVLFVLNMWLLRDLLRLRSDYPFGTLLADFVTTTDPPLEERAYFKFIHQWLKKNYYPLDTLRGSTSVDVISTAPSLHLPIGSPPPSPPMLMDLDDTAIAQQLTYIDNKLFRALKFSDLLHKNFQEPEKSQGFNAMMRKFNMWGAWVITEIVSEKLTIARAAVINKFIRIAQICLDLKSFNTAYAVVAGLNNSAVTRLKITWGHVPKEGQTTFNFLQHVFDMTKNFYNYRTVLQASAPPLVPFLGLYPKDLAPIEENVPTLQNQNLISLSKLRTLHEIIRPLQEYQLGKNYVIKRDSILQKYLKNVKVLGPEEIYQQSLSCEARASSVKLSPSEGGMFKFGTLSLKSSPLVN
jgi:hypothetical protein